ncbi:phosphatidylglycerophosphatase and protein-tyrosine phosphatase 1-like [Artemia franciscana]|uniref:phosphatidylglycerophosphatase and protein-tyrosine phosphatase 1-like n=1 Tax=Artemia franciscana TaxID=6661 RepID=UPI0032DB6726
MTDESSTDQTEDQYASSSSMRHLLARAAFLPSLAYNLVMERVTGRQWFNRVDQTVILGALPFPSMTKELVDEHNVRGVISLNEDYELYFSNSSDDWLKSGVQFMQLSAVDFFDAPEQEKLIRGVRFILDMETNGYSVYVHCKAGRTRSATLVGCYLMEKYGYTPEQAIEFMRSKRAHVLLHPPHMEALNEFYKTCASPRVTPDGDNKTSQDLKTEQN